MNRRHVESGFSSLVIILMLVLSVAVTSGIYVYEQHQKALEDNLSEGNFIPGNISITFRDGVTFQQAKNVISSYGLVLDRPDSDYEGGFTPWDYRSIKDDQFNQISNKLRTIPEVTSFIDASSDGSSRAGPGYKWVKVTFRQDVTETRIVAILKSSGLGLGETPDHPVIVSRIIYFNVPYGQENNYLNKFRRNSMVQSADRVGRLILQ